MNNYFFYFFDGDVLHLKGNSVKDAFASGGLSAGCIHSVDFYEESQTQRYFFQDNKWVKIQ